MGAYCSTFTGALSLAGLSLGDGTSPRDDDGSAMFVLPRQKMGSKLVCAASPQSGTQCIPFCHCLCHDDGGRGRISSLYVSQTRVSTCPKGGKAIVHSLRGWNKFKILQPLLSTFSVPHFTALSVSGSFPGFSTA